MRRTNFHAPFGMSEETTIVVVHRESGRTVDVVRYLERDAPPPIKL